MRRIYSCSLVLISSLISAQQIILDDVFDDWQAVAEKYEDYGDASGLDLEELQISNDNSYLYLRVKVNQEILLQENNGITVAIDFDSDPDSGFDFGALGAELYFSFGTRSGRLFGFSGDINHDAIGLIAAPTVSGNEFEIAIKRTVASFNGVRHTMSDQVKVKLFSNFFNGDELPNDVNGAVYRLGFRNQEIASYAIEKVPEADFRFLSFNVLRDNIFENSVRDEFRNILTALNPDVMCFQEIYEHNAVELINYLDDIGVLENKSDWTAVKHGPDIITLSRFPVVYNQSIAGNGMLVLEIDGNEIVVFNLHLPCCENDDGREEEIDRILQYIRESKSGNQNYKIEDQTPYIICGDMNFVGQGSQVTALRTGNIFNNSSYGPDLELDWDKNGLADLRPNTTGFTSSFTWYSPFSSFFPGRLDYIFYTDSRLESLNHFVLNTVGLTNEEQYTYNLFGSTSLNASDHMPLVTDFRIRNLDAVSESGLANFRIYPNPSKGQLFIEKGTMPLESLVITDFQGRIVKTLESLNNIESITLERGMYVFQFVARSGKRYPQIIFIK